MRELAELKKSPPEGIRIQTSEEDMLDVTGIIEGPGEYRVARRVLTRSTLLRSMWVADKCGHRGYPLRRRIL